MVRKDLCIKVLYHQIPRSVQQKIAIHQARVLVPAARVMWNQRRETLEPLLNFCGSEWITRGFLRAVALHAPVV